MTHDQEPPSDPTRDQIRAELADHLAESAAQQTRGGLDPVEAEARARAQFGNVARVERACWWIQTGDEIMFRTIAVGLLVAVTIGLVAVTLGGLRLQANIAHRMDQLAHQLTEVNATQRSLLAAQQATQPRGLRGRTYLGDPSEPAAGAEVFILRMPEALLVRRLRTDAQGRFEVSSLPPGEYSLVARLIGPGNELLQAGYFVDNFALTSGMVSDDSAYHIQSRPFYLDPRSTPAEVELDLLFRQGDLAFGLSQALPDKIEVNGALVLPYLVKPNGLASQLKLGHGGILQTKGQNPAATQQSEDTSEQTASVPMDVAEWLDSGTQLTCERLEPQYGPPFGAAISGEDGIMIANIPDFGPSSGVGKTKIRHEYVALLPDKYLPIEIRHAMRTHVEIQVPANLEAGIREVLSLESPTVDQLSEALRARILPLKVKSFEPLPDEH